MNEPVTDTPATTPAPPINPVARMLGAITAPAATFEDVARRPAWLMPLVIYVVVFLAVFGVYSMRADWVSIITQQIESFPLMRMAPDQARDQAVREATAEISPMSPFQRTLYNMNNFPSGLLFFFHGMALLYATLFVMMGAVPKLELGKAWLNLLVCLLVFLAYLAVVWVARLAFPDAIDSRLLLTLLATAAVFAGWVWFLNRRARADLEFHRILSVCTTAAGVMAVGLLAWLAVTLITPQPIQTPPEQMVKANLGAVVSTGMPAVQKLLESLDVFTLWTLAVLTLGFRPVTRLSTGVTAAITFLPWGIWVLLKVAWAAVFG
jgi:hypothetical protein